MIQQLNSVAGDGPALAGGNVLGLLEAEAAQIAQRAALATLVFAQPRLAGVLNDGQVVFLGDSVNRVHVAGHAVNVNRQNGAGPFGDAALDRSRVHRQRGGVRVGEHRQCLVHQNGVIGCTERKGRSDHFVTGVHAHDIQGGHQRGGAAGGGHAAFGAEQFRVGLFKIPHFPAAAGRAPSSAAQHFEDFRLPGLAPLRPRGPAPLVCRCAAEQGRLVGCRRRTGCGNAGRRSGGRDAGDKSATRNRLAHASVPLAGQRAATCDRASRYVL